MTKITVTRKQLEEIISKVIAECLQIKEDNNNVELLTKEEVCKMLNISLSTLNRWISDGAIIPVKISRKCVRFSAEQIKSIAA